MMADKKRILLIDDEKDFCSFVKSNLEQTGEFEVAYATDPDTGINIAKKDAPDLIFLDILMPKMEGSKVADILLNDPCTKNIPLIFLTAIVTEEEIGPRAFKEIGGYNFIAKPVTTKKLISCIKMTLEEKEKADYTD